MSDYDVFNLHFTPENANDIDQKQSLYVCGEPSYLFYATRDMCSAAIMKFINQDIFDLTEKDMVNSVNKDVSSKLVKHCYSAKGKKRSEVMQGLA